MGSGYCDFLFSFLVDLPLSNAGLLLKERICPFRSFGEEILSFNPMNTGQLFHCYMLDKSICHFRGVGSTLLLLLYF